MHPYTVLRYKFGYIPVRLSLGLTQEESIYYGAGIRTKVLLSANCYGEYISICIHSLFLYLWSFRLADATLARVNDQNDTQEESKRFMMSKKRVILADGSRLLREMLHRVIDKTENLEVIREVSNPEDLPAAVARFDPEWVIISLPVSNPVRNGIDACMAVHPSVRFLFLSPDSNSITLKRQAGYEEDLPNLTLKDFLDILAEDLQCT